MHQAWKPLGGHLGDQLGPVGGLEPPDLSAGQPGVLSGYRRGPLPVRWVGLHLGVQIAEYFVLSAVGWLGEEPIQ